MAGAVLEYKHHLLSRARYLHYDAKVSHSGDEFSVRNTVDVVREAGLSCLLILATSNPKALTEAPHTFLRAAKARLCNGRCTFAV